MKGLIVGGLGKTAEPIVDLLCKSNYNIRIFDISTENSYNHRDVEVVCGNICNFSEINDAMCGMDAVIHLAVNTTDTNSRKLSFDTNVFGTYNVLRCALNNNVRKTLVASSAPVHTAKELMQTRKLNLPDDYYCSAGDDFTYDLTKNIQEIIARNFSQTYAMNNMVMRLGHIVDGKSELDMNGVPLSEVTYCRGGWVCKYDVARAFAKAVETDFTGYHLVHIIGSYQAADLFDLTSAKELLGFECDENFHEYKEVAV